MKKFNGENVIFELNAEFMEISASTASSKVEWKGFDQLIIFKNFWFLMISPQIGYMLPNDTLNDEIQDFIRSRLHENNVKILMRKSL